MLAISGTGREGFVVCYPLEDRIIVKEMAVGPRRFEDVLAALHARYRAARYQIRIPEDFDCGRPSRPLPFAMVRWYDKTIQARCNSYIGQPPYISHVLD